MVEARPATGSDVGMRPFAASLPMALLQAREATMKRFRPMLAARDLTEQQWRVLRALVATDEPLTAGEVAERTFLLGPSLSRILTNLEERNLIERAAGAHDQRQSVVVLADPGRELVRQIAPNSESTYNDIEEGFGADRLQRLMSELHDFCSVVNGPGEEEQRRETA